MRGNVPARAAAALFLALISTGWLAGCSTTGQRLDTAGTAIGAASAKVLLPPWPPHCRQPVPHADLAEGVDAVAGLDLERAQLDFANQRAANCAGHYERTRAAFAGQ